MFSVSYRRLYSMAVCVYKRFPNMTKIGVSVSELSNVSVSSVAFLDVIHVCAHDPRSYGTEWVLRTLRQWTENSGLRVQFLNSHCLVLNIVGFMDYLFQSCIVTCKTTRCGLKIKDFSRTTNKWRLLSQSYCVLGRFMGVDYINFILKCVGRIWDRHFWT